MTPFKYARAHNPAEAVNLVANHADASYLGGGTNLLDLMKEGVQGATQLVDLTRLDLKEIKEVNGGLRIGALARNADTANHPLVRTKYPLLSQAILAGASAQIRNMATDGGNMLQRTRCAYFYDSALPCNKREPGSGCGAREGLNTMHAIFGWSDQCVAVHPSDMCVALAALGATVRIRGVDGKERTVPFVNFHRLPGEEPQRDNVLAHGELITAIDLPAPLPGTKAYYLKVRDRTSYAFALVSVAANVTVANGVIQKAAIAMGGVAHKPWRAYEAEKVLKGKKPTPALFEEAANAEMKAARPLEHNEFKVDLGRNAIVRALSETTGVNA